MLGKSTCPHGVEYETLSNPSRVCFQCAIKRQKKRKENKRSTQR